MSGNRSESSDKIIVDRTRRRSPAARLVTDLRQRAMNGSGAQIEYQRELMVSFAENHRNAFAILPAFIALVALIAASYVGVVPSVYWFLLTSLVYGLMAALAARFLREPREEIAVAQWRRTFLLVQAMIAFVWMMFALYGCMTCTDNSYAIIQFSSILVFQAITMILSYGMGWSLLVTSAPPTLALTLRFVLSYEPVMMLMAGILVAAQAFFFLLGIRLKRSVLSILLHKAEKESLIAELETARSISEEARRRAEEANLAKSRFLATMSHELRTPLNAILGFSEVMNNEVLGPIGNESYKEYVSDIHNSGQHLLNVINEILDLSRIEAGRYELNEEALRLAHVVDEACHMIQLKARAKNIAVVTQYEEDLPRIWADERAVRQVALNLLSNALKFTPPGGTIWVKVGWTSTGGQYLSVKDTGPGIPEEEIPVVLSTFGQGSIAIKSAEQGTGLGLPIVQALMHMHDGRFELRSKLREGTQVIASFPRSRVLEIMPPVANDAPGKQRPRSIRTMRKHA
ncbi:MAG: two-component sensor histidine kinase [Alphaproteobacteria bacterium]|nr:MAG: two-component sensor histidine kinase [Alphaproteobacteria bacterium]